MKFGLKLLPWIFAGFLVSCHEEDEIVPAKTFSDSTSSKSIQHAVTDSTSSQQPSDSLTRSAALRAYEYGSFGNLPYRFLKPKAVSSAQKYPMVIVLHGIGERGTDNEQQLAIGSSLFATDSVSSRYPSFVVYPQCPQGAYWFDQAILNNLDTLIDHLISTHPIDIDRIYIVGFSMGAYGTYALVPRDPDLFAAAVAIAGDGDLHQVRQMIHPKWRIIAGDKDAVVPSQRSERMADALKQSGAEVDLEILHGIDHGTSMTKAFSEPDFCSWLFSKHRN